MIPHRPNINTSLGGPTRRALTLVEMMLVLAVLAVIAAITWPGIHRSLINQKMDEATEMVRIHLGRTRNYAIDSVLIYEFRYEPDGNRFVIVPHEPLGDLSGTTNIDPLGQVSQGSPADQLVRVAGVLRNGVRFTSVVNNDAVELGIPEIKPPPVPLADWQIEGLPNSDELRGVGWSEPMLFYPDGSAQQSVLRLEDQYGQQMEISVRGLTGALSPMGAIRIPAYPHRGRRTSLHPCNR
ncbi:MAG: prepilin-type N-terminal cleavage/methylation domain-containing protein [Planctomycetaceae bacterium]|nr:prepilin-type N-terminal cleavage/methylation domain-containing protein [Planctomycetaceae bacterium]